MTAIEYWIDGYNVIGRRQWTATMTLEQARERLLRMLVPLQTPVRVWFDAQRPGAPSSATMPSPDPRVKPVFVKGRSADDAMLEALRTAKPGTVTLVTDDRELRNRAKQLGANALGVEKFLADLEARNAPPSPKPAARPAPSGEKPGHLSKKEVEEWMKVFGFNEDEVDPPAG